MGTTARKIHRDQYDATNIYELEALIRQKLKHRKESLRDLANEIGVSHTYLSNVEHGRSVCIMVLNAIANYYGIHYKVENFEEKNPQFIR